MQQETPILYYMVVDEKSTGPYTLDEITLHPALTPETLVWKPGIENWVAAKTLPELAPAFINQPIRDQYQTPPQYNQNPYQSEGNPNGNTYHNDGYNQTGRNPYGPQQEPNPFANNPQYQNNHTYHNHNRYHDRYDRYQNGYRPNMRTNWLPWAIVATVVGFFASCIGAIFGIIAIVQANKANTLYAQGFDQEADASNSNAKIMTIIGLIFAGIGILVALSFGNLFSTISNLAYY
ncbi:MAG: DUF4339 domain-containing protein [Muribaculaceae bacterium]|nr:DUF4339 domain-containing protein [Muribaculaceae bacterium]